MKNVIQAEELMADKWLKLAVTFCDDEKIKIIRAHEGGDSFVWLWLWLLTTAMKKETDTLCIVAGLPYDPETIARSADVKVDTVNKGMELFLKLKMVQVENDGGICILNFHKHQAVAEMQHKRQLATDRKRKQREKESAQITYIPPDVTRDTCDSHATEKRREDEEEEKIKDIPAQKPPAKVDRLTDQQKANKINLWEAWQEQYTARYKIPYKATIADWKQINDRSILDLDQERIRKLVKAWFAAPEAEQKFFPPYLKNFATGFERAESIKGTSKDTFTKIKGW